jgi:hypothetical protein
MMKIMLLLLTFLSLNFAASSQKRVNNYYLTTSKAIANVSSQWKLDSIGTNKFRHTVFDDLRHSKVDNISKEYLFKMLGKPNQVSRFFSGNTKENYVGFIYYVLCMNDYPKEKWFSGPYIQFVFDESEESLQFIEDGDFCG